MQELGNHNFSFYVSGEDEAFYTLLLDDELYDGDISPALKALNMLPSFMSEIGESVFESELPPEETVKNLTALGWRQLDELR